MSSSPTGPSAYDPAAGEKLIIETPEQTSIEFPLAGIGSRFLAVLIDFLIQIAVLIVLGLMLCRTWDMAFAISFVAFLHPSAHGSRPLPFCFLLF